MVHAQKITQLQWDGDALESMLPSVEASPWGALESPGQVLGGAWLFRYENAAQHVLIAARMVPCDHGKRLDVVGIRSLGDRFAAADLGRAVDFVARETGADLLAMTTRHEHLVKACQRAGWTRSGFVVIKPVNLQ